MKISQHFTHIFKVLPVKKGNFMKRVLVIGAGASGLVAAIEAARLGAKVTVIEKNNKIGK